MNLIVYLNYFYNLTNIMDLVSAESDSKSHGVTRVPAESLPSLSRVLLLLVPQSNDSLSEQFLLCPAGGRS